MALWTFLQGVVAEAYKYFWVGSVCVCVPSISVTNGCTKYELYSLKKYTGANI